MKLIDKLLKYVSNNPEPIEEIHYKGENFDRFLNQKIKEKEDYQKKVESQLKDGTYEHTKHEKRLLRSIEDKRQSIIKLYEQIDWTQEKYIGSYEITNLKALTEKILNDSYIGVVSKLPVKNLKELSGDLYECKCSLEEQLLSQEIAEVLKNIFKILQAELTWKTYDTFDIDLRLRKYSFKEIIKFKGDGTLVVRYGYKSEEPITYVDIRACRENLITCKKELEYLMKTAKMI